MGCSGAKNQQARREPIENMKNYKQNLMKIGINNKEDINQNIKNGNNIKEKNDNTTSFEKDREEFDEKLIVPPTQKEYIIEGNTEIEKNIYKKRSCKGLTILENVKEYMPETISREEVKNMVYNALGNTIVKDKYEYVKGKNLTKDQVEIIIDLLLKTITENENIEQEDFDDERFNDVKVNIGFYDVNVENVRRIIFREENPSKEEIENMLNEISGGNENTKLLAVELQD